MQKIKFIYLFGQFTQNNYSLEENLQKLVVNYRELAKQGNPEAQYKYGMFLRQGIGVKKNFREALKYLKLSAKQNFSPAENNI